jgi:integrase
MAKDLRPSRSNDHLNPEMARRFSPDFRNTSGSGLLDTLRGERLLAFPLLDEIERKVRADPHKQAELFFQQFAIPAGTGRGRKVGERTKDSYLYAVHWVIDRLRELNIPLQKLSQFGPKTARHILRLLDRGPYEASFRLSILTVMRRWLIWIGKVDALGSNGAVIAELDLDPSKWQRTANAKVPKTLRSKDVDIEVVLARMEAKCPVAAVQLAMQVFFGLRKKESLFLEPAKCDEGSHLLVYRGTKGGHERRIRIRTVQQRTWLERAKQLAALHPRKVLGVVPVLPWQKADRRFRTMCEAVGLTAKGEFHTTPHGLRHEYLCRLYEEIAGTLPPVEGGAPADPGRHAAAAQAIVDAAGHHDSSKANSYVGSYNALKRQCSREEKVMYERFQGDLVQSALSDACVSSLLLIGDAARGFVKADATTLVAYEPNDHGDSREIVKENTSSLVELLQSVIGTRVELAERTPQHLAAKHTLEIQVRRPAP